MKKIEAVIRKTKFDEVKDALTSVGAGFFSYWDVRGVGRARQERVYRGVVYDTSSIERVTLTMVVNDDSVDKIVKTIIETGQTGEVGDGKVFVFDVQNSYRIRTEEVGEKSL